MEARQDSLSFLIADISRLMRRTFAQRLGTSALTLAQARALVYLSRHDGIRQVELACLLEVQPMTLARLIDQLCEAGLVERRPDPEDRRAYCLHLTDAAGAHLLAIDRVITSMQAEALRGVDKSQSAILYSGLRAMRDNLARPAHNNNEGDMQ